MNVDALRGAAARVRLHGGEDGAARGVTLQRTWDGPRCRIVLANDGDAPVRVAEAIPFSGRHTLPPPTPFYGEGFQMLTQTAGTLGSSATLGKYSDHGHYKLAQPADALTAYGLATLEPRPGWHLVLCFTSCHRFVGSLRFGRDWFEVALDLENLTLAPGERWELEELFCAEGPHRDVLLAEAASAIERHHPRLPWASPPTGWCSWYWFGPHVSEQDILDNLTAIATRGAALRYVQIDDGYQPYMGDWLEPGDRFPSGLPALCRRIREAGFEPAIWVAPFIAEHESRLFREHPDWFVQDGRPSPGTPWVWLPASGAPLRSDAISFGGWRRGPWYMLDGTHPEAQAYLERVFRTMRDEWGCHYFKLDALTWGALPGGRRFDPAATRVEAYRRGMAALRRGAGEGSFLLGCNAPMWPSLGGVQGMRVSNDVSRSWAQLSLVARECFWRSWQHNRLWINDPDCVVLENRLTGRRGPSSVSPDEFGFHAAAVLATGGMVLSGDNLAALPSEKWSVLQRLLPPTDAPARFTDTTWQVGWIERGDARLLCLFNWDDAPAERAIALDAPLRVSDYWTGEDLGTHSGTLRLPPLPPHAARVLRCTRPSP